MEPAAGSLCARGASGAVSILALALLMTDCGAAEGHQATSDAGLRTTTAGDLPTTTPLPVPTTAPLAAIYPATTRPLIDGNAILESFGFVLCMCPRQVATIPYGAGWTPVHLQSRFNTGGQGSLLRFEVYNNQPGRLVEVDHGYLHWSDICSRNSPAPGSNS